MLENYLGLGVTPTRIKLVIARVTPTTGGTFSYYKNLECNVIFHGGKQ